MSRAVHYNYNIKNFSKIKTLLIVLISSLATTVNKGNSYAFVIKSLTHLPSTHTWAMFLSSPRKQNFWIMSSRVSNPKSCVSHFPLIFTRRASNLRPTSKPPTLSSKWQTLADPRVARAKAPLKSRLRSRPSVPINTLFEVATENRMLSTIDGEYPGRKAFGLF